MRTDSATLRPCINCAACRRSVMRELVQLPMKYDINGLPKQLLARRQIHIGQRLLERNLLVDIALVFGLAGTAALIGMPMPGLVP